MSPNIPHLSYESETTSCQDNSLPETLSSMNRLRDRITVLQKMVGDLGDRMNHFRCAVKRDAPEAPKDIQASSDSIVVRELEGLQDRVNQIIYDITIFTEEIQ